MARGKHAAALFEVIHSGRHPNKPVLTTPKWWFKRQGGTQLAAIAAASPAPHTKARTPFDQTVPGDSHDDVASEPMSDDVGSEVFAKDFSIEAVPAELQPTKVHPVCGVRANEASGTVSNNDADVASFFGENANIVPNEEIAAPAIPTPARRASTSSRGSGWQKFFSTDGVRHQIAFRLSYANLAATGVAILLAIGLAFVVGRKMSRGPELAIATETSEQLRGKPAHPDVLDLIGVHSSKPKESVNTESSQVHEPELAMSSRSTDFAKTGLNDTKKHASLPTTAPTAPTPLASVDREVGLNYVVIQSYPDEKGATDARESLQKAGVTCTVEQGLRGLPKTWFCVVGSQGFQRISSADCQAYVRNLDQISKQFASGKHSFKAFEPMAYKWDRAKAS